MNNLRTLRESKNLSQKKLAEMFDLSQSQIYAYEKSLYQPDIDTLKGFSKFFETSIDYIVGNTDIIQRIEYREKHELSATELSLIEKYRVLPPQGKENITMIVNSFFADKV